MNQTSRSPALSALFVATHLTSFKEDQREVRIGNWPCEKEHVYEIEDGIIRFATGFDHEAVKRELEYVNTTYQGSDRFARRKTDRAISRNTF